MKHPLPRPLFPGLQVTQADRDELSALTAAFIDKLLTEEHAFRVTRRGHVDAVKWKHVRQSENMAVYRERPVAPTPSSPAPSPHTSHKLLPPLLTVGSVPGSLDELLYGLSTPTRESSIIRTSYMDGSIVDVDILHTIQAPTLDEPFSNVTVKWLLLAPHSSFVTPRDYVYLCAQGTRVLPDGERIGFRFSHSIELRGAGAMAKHGFIRANFSFSTIFRDDPANQCVREYGRAFYAPGGVIPHSVFMVIVSLQASDTAAHRTVGELKKLALALRLKHTGKWMVARTAATLPSVVLLTRRSSLGPSSPDSECGVCAKRLHLLTKSRFDCALCECKLCHACSVRKELSFLRADLSVKRLRVTFCAGCVQQAIAQPSVDVVREEFLTHHEQFFYLEPDSLRGEKSSAASKLRTMYSLYKIEF